MGFTYDFSLIGGVYICTCTCVLEVFITSEKADKTMVLRNVRTSSIITLLEEDKNVTFGIRILNFIAINSFILLYIPRRSHKQPSHTVVENHNKNNIEILLNTGYIP